MRGMRKRATWGYSYAVPETTTTLLRRSGRSGTGSSQAPSSVPRLGATLYKESGTGTSGRVAK